jgi:hypothetical protein
MTCLRTAAPKIEWGPLYANTLYFGYPLINWTVSSRAFEESTFLQIESGEEDAWIINTEYYLEGDVRFISAVDTVTPLQTGWDGPTGWQEFLLYARKKGFFYFYPDATNDTVFYESYLVEPMSGAPTLSGDGTRTIRLYIRNATTPYDGY